MTTGIKLSLLAVIILTLAFSTAIPTFATDYTVDGSSACTLPDAIKAANGDSAVGNCPAGAGHDTIYLSGDITLGADLPTISSQLTVTSNDHAIKRVISGSRAYRLFNSRAART